MKVWHNWKDAMNWLEDQATGDCWILTTDWIEGQVSIMKYVDCNLWYFGKWMAQ
jgi:hypothetical protein